MTSRGKIMLGAAVVAAGVGVYLYTRKKSASGSVGVSVDRETYYGASGRCFRGSDDVEVAASECTKRGVSVGGLAGLVSNLFGSVA